MAFDLRPLYATVGLGRSDVDPAVIGYCLQRAMRDVCRKSELARNTYEYTFTASNNSISISVANGNPIRVVSAFWKGSLDTDYTTLYPKNLLESQTNEYWKLTGKPEAFSEQGPVVILYPTPTTAGTLRLAVAYVPTTDLDTAPLPDAAIEALEARAEALLWKVMGPGQNLQMALTKDHEYRRALAHLKSLSIFGEVGPLQMVAPKFA